MKVAIINSVCGRGSTGRIAVSIAQRAYQNGAEAVVVYGRNESSYPHSFKMSSKLDNSVHGMITRVLDLHGLGSKAATRGLIRFLKKEDPDIINLHNIHGYYVNYELLFRYLRRSGKPVIWTMHDCWAITGHCTHFDLQGCEKWKTQCKNCPLKKEYPSSYLADHSAGNYKRKKAAFTSVERMVVITPSQWLAEIMHQSFLKDYEVRVIHNGIDLSVFKPVHTGEFRKAYGLEGKKVLLGVAYGFGECKGLSDFIALSGMVDEDTRIVLVGVEKKSMPSLPENVIGIERTENVRQLVEIYSESDVFLNLTYEDNFPTVNLEALACGTPVITYRTGGSPEALTEECGFVVEKHDLAGILDAVRQISRNPISPENCRKRAECFDQERAFDGYIELMNEMVNEK